MGNHISTPRRPFCTLIWNPSRPFCEDLAEQDTEMGSYAQQYGPGPVWYYEEPPRPAPPPPPAVPVRYSHQSGDMFNQPSVYTTYPPTDPGLSIQNSATSFGTPTSFENPPSSVRQGTSPVSGSDRRRYRIKRIRTVSIRILAGCEEVTDHSTLTNARPVKHVVLENNAAMVANPAGPA